jgi:uncharacterized protein (DUF1015 family)
MNDIRAFRGLRFDEAVAGQLGSVICPPYDVISPLEQVELHGRGPHNVVRLELGLEFPEDDDGSNRYTRAADTMRRWLAEGVLKAEQAPALYLYEQQFPLDGSTIVRRGLLAALRLAPWEAGVVLPHEETMAKPKADRLRLMRATACNLSPLFLLYDDPSGDTGRLLARVAGSPPTGEADTGDGQVHRLWVIQGDDMNAIVAALREPQLYMADGHHRYETALAYRDEKAASDPSGDPEAAYNFAMTLLVDARDPGLVVLPTHRLIREVSDERLSALTGELVGRFDVETISVEGDASVVAEAITKRMREVPAGESVLGFYLANSEGPMILRHRSVGRDSARRGRPVLDVDVLQEMVLEPLLGIGPEDLEAGTLIGYTRDAAEAVDAVNQGTAQAAFLLNPTRVEQVLETARAHGRMPQKSTYFYPKPETGLVINGLT